MVEGSASYFIYSDGKIKIKIILIQVGPFV